MAATTARIFHFCESCSPTNGQEVFECGSDFPYCAGGHFARRDLRAHMLEVDLKDIIPADDPSQSRNGGDYEYRVYTVVDGGKEPATETAVDLIGQSSPVFLGAPAPTLEEEVRMNRETEALWAVMDRNAAGLGGSR